MKKHAATLLLLAAFAGVVVPLVAAAQGAGDFTLPGAPKFPFWGPLVSCTGVGPAETQCKDLCNIMQTMQNFTYFGLTVLFIILAPIFFLYGGIVIMTAGGSTERVGKGRTIVTGTFIGSLIALAAFLAINFFLYLLGAVKDPSGAQGIAFPDIACQVRPFVPLEVDFEHSPAAPGRGGFQTRDYRRLLGNECKAQYDACRADTGGCREIIECVRANGCRDVQECYGTGSGGARPGSCGGVIDEKGGIGGTAAAKAKALGDCLLQHDSGSGGIQSPGAGACIDRCKAQTGEKCEALQDAGEKNQCKSDRDKIIECTRAKGCATVGECDTADKCKPVIDPIRTGNPRAWQAAQDLSVCVERCAPTGGGPPVSEVCKSCVDKACKAEADACNVDNPVGRGCQEIVKCMQQSGCHGDACLVGAASDTRRGFQNKEYADYCVKDGSGGPSSRGPCVPDFNECGDNEGCTELVNCVIEKGCNTIDDCNVPDKCRAIIDKYRNPPLPTDVPSVEGAIAIEACVTGLCGGFQSATYNQCISESGQCGTAYRVSGANAQEIVSCVRAKGCTTVEGCYTQNLCKSLIDTVIRRTHPDPGRPFQLARQLEACAISCTTSRIGQAPGPCAKEIREQPSGSWLAAQALDSCAQDKQAGTCRTACTSSGGGPPRFCPMPPNDDACTARGGTCQDDSITCSGGSYVSCFCSGPRNRRCCVPGRPGGGTPPAYTCPGGKTCDGRDVTGTPNQVVCGANSPSTQFKCTSNGWVDLRTSCSCSGGGGSTPQPVKVAVSIYQPGSGGGVTIGPSGGAFAEENIFGAPVPGEPVETIFYSVVNLGTSPIAARQLAGQLWVVRSNGAVEPFGQEQLQTSEIAPNAVFQFSVSRPRIPVSYAPGAYRLYAVVKRPGAGGAEEARSQMYHFNIVKWDYGCAYRRPIWKNIFMCDGFADGRPADEGKLGSPRDPIRCAEAQYKVKSDGACVGGCRIIPATCCAKQLTSSNLPRECLRFVPPGYR